MWPFNLFNRKKDEDRCACGKPRITSTTKIEVKGVMHTFTNSPKCKKCTDEYMNKYATECAVCGDPIIPGEPVGVSGDPDLPYVHLSFDCTETGGQFVGHWGEGKLNPANFE